MADGDIHVYGRLQGRAIAGLSGCGTASVFARSFEASLVGISDAFFMPDNHTDLLREMTGKTVSIQRVTNDCNNGAAEKGFFLRLLKINIFLFHFFVSLIPNLHTRI